MGSFGAAFVALALWAFASLIESHGIYEFLAEDEPPSFGTDQNDSRDFPEIPEHASYAAALQMNLKGGNPISIATISNPIPASNDDKYSRNLLIGMDYGVRCNDADICTGVTTTYSPSLCSTPGGCEGPAYPYPGYEGGWGYEYEFVENLPNGYGNFPSATDEEINAIDAATNGLVVKVDIAQSGTECTVTIGDDETCQACSLDLCEDTGNPCEGSGCGSIPAPLSIRYDCTNLKFGNAIGNEVGITDFFAGCADLNPFLYPFSETVDEAAGGPGEEASNEIPQVRYVEYVELGVYSIDYFLPNRKIPRQSDYLQLSQATRDYFRDFMFDIYSVSTQENLADFVTKAVSHTILSSGFNTRVSIQFSSRAAFDTESVTIPTPGNVFSVLEKALANPQPYLDRLAAVLPASNIFKSTPRVNYDFPSFLATQLFVPMPSTDTDAKKTMPPTVRIQTIPPTVRVETIPPDASESSAYSRNSNHLIVAALISILLVDVI